MDSARYEAMDAQRFDPMRRMKAPPSLAPPSAEKDMGQVLRRLSHPDLPPTGVVGGIWSDHELVLVPLEVSESTRDSFGSVLAESVSFSSASVSGTPSVSSSTSSYFTTSSPIVENAPRTSSSLGSRSPPSARTGHADTADREDLIVTRTIIRPITQSSSMRSILSRPSSPTIRPTSPFTRPTSPVLQALNCFRSIGFEKDLEDVQQTERTTQPVLQVIVTQTREQYEQDMAFKEAVQEVYPEACRRRRTIH